MKNESPHRQAESNVRDEASGLSLDALARRELLIGSAAFGAAILTGPVLAATDGKKTFTILHTNDMHSNFIGMGPASDYTASTLNDDGTRGGYARIATLIATRKKARAGQGPVLVPPTRVASAARR